MKVQRWWSVTDLRTGRTEYRTATFDRMSYRTAVLVPTLIAALLIAVPATAFGAIVLFNAVVLYFVYELYRRL